ncbi:MAG: hypothetical protein HYR66_15020 [Sphingobacteriales bacterium]|nr:hypothetical protein [Sphingobacteriales bacterium]MBI3720163.1 hypothetical protein [Sphingobacteriales bacterium]
MQYKLEKPVHGTIGTEKYKCVVEWRNGKFIADEPENNGGKDEGPDPYTLLYLRKPPPKAVVMYFRLCRMCKFVE